jgi:hypothetical protein
MPDQPLGNRLPTKASSIFPRKPVGTIADLVYRGRGDLILRSLMSHCFPWRPTGEHRGRGCLFPHVYGELALTAVVRAESVTPKDDGTFDLRGLLEECPSTHRNGGTLRHLWAFG